MFRTETVQGTIKVKRVTIDVSKRTTFSKEPIKESLLPLDETSNNLAIKTFENIMRIMKDLPPTKKSDEDLIREVIQVGIDNVSIRSEIFCQLCKQLTQNPKM